ncbi:hypothetical protein BP5796_01168 [Coleophoma crateriformis]|uniref:FAD-binding PCMH-type domain-containing protein n=1 Tax=Coleophoma crateriformis TaxID=565419 RepID=A0A3D8SZQ4_9HELO|nr:hypothetical protein BP5796_01168 [Coleophoma crateriformis]
MYILTTAAPAALAWLCISSSPVLAFIPHARAALFDILSSSSNCWAANTTIYASGTAQFENVTERWTLFDAPTYSAVISPGTEADLVKAVQLARANDISFLATGGRHGYTTTLGELQGGLEIDLGQFDTVEVDTSAKTVTLGGAVQIGQVLDPLYNAGFWMQTGSCTCPGVVGVSLGGGIGRFTGLYGLILDGLTHVRMVTAEGEVIEASETINPDLFWGLRGAGFNFGIVVSATYTIHELTNSGQVMSADMILPANMSSAYFEALQSYNGSMPELLATVTLITYSTAADDVSHGQSPKCILQISYSAYNDLKAQIIANWVYLGSEEAGRAALAPILDLNPPTLNITEVTWPEVYYSAGWGFDYSVCQKSVARDLYSNTVRNLSASTYDMAFSKMQTFYADYPNARGSSVEFEIFANQAMSAVSSDLTAYPWRDALGYVSQSYSGWATDDTTTAAAAAALAVELRKDFAATSGYPELAVYINYAHGDETLEQKYGADKLPRLAALKKTWDPDNVFGYNNALPTSYP